MKQELFFKRVTENALEFITKAIECFAEEPKYSIINFYSAVELFLKARLMHEHWSLAVAKDPDLEKFKAGDFASVTFEMACERLNKIVQSPITASARANLDTVRKHRNSMVHFTHEIDRKDQRVIEHIAREQLRAWCDVNRLLTQQWKEVFEEYHSQIVEIEKKLKRHREYLKAVFGSIKDRVADEIRNGATFVACEACGFEAMQTDSVVENLYDGSCLVCGHHERFLDYTCNSCRRTSHLREGGVL